MTIKTLAARSALKSRRCAKCPLNTFPKRKCTEEILNACLNSFIEGFIKGHRKINNL